MKLLYEPKFFIFVVVELPDIFLLRVIYYEWIVACSTTNKLRFSNRCLSRSAIPCIASII